MALLLGIAAWTLTSCQDWLTITPTTQVVEENYWEDKNDLEGVRYAAYTQMCSTLEKMVLWGDLRSDSYSLNNDDRSSSIPDLYQEIREGRIDRDSASTYFDWSGFYTTINYCNKVLQHGSEVLERDKQFTNAEWLQMKAEVTALRALNYFYLIRAFKDVPYSTKVVNKDTEVLYLGATNQLVVLDSLIADVEAVKGQARNRFSKKTDTKGMITNPAIYAMLSDMYLWRASLHEGRGITTDTVYINNVATRDSNYVVHTVTGDYNKSIEYADLALSTLAIQNEDQNSGFGISRSEKINYGLTNCDMYKNEYDNFINGNTPQLTAHGLLYSTQNCEESLFELQFSTSDSRKNDVVTSQWGVGDYVHLVTSSGALAAIYSDANEMYRDSRMWFSAWDKILGSTTNLTSPHCFKWYSVMAVNPDDHQCNNLKIVTGTSNYSYRNWIIYRLSDVMLQKAEALAALDQGKEAMRYVNAIHRRWYCNDSKSITGQPSEDVTDNNGIALNTGAPTTAATLGNAPMPSQSKGEKGTITDKEKYEIAVLNERQLEFIGEGKRWFDLVRYAERHAGGQDGTKDVREWTEETPIGSGKTGVDLMVDNFLRSEFNNNYGTLKNHFKNRYGLYNLIYYKEIQASQGKLEQNPVWNKTTYEQ